jgi:hypothetical protein
MSITYKRHPDDGNINCIGVDINNKIIFDIYLVGKGIGWIDVYNQEGKWRGKKIAEFKLKL